MTSKEQNAMPFADKKIKMITALCTVIMAGFALSTSMYSTLLPSIIKHYNLSLTYASWFNMVSDIGYVMAMLFSLLFADRMKKNRIIAVSTILFAASMIFMGCVPISVIMVALRMAMGITGSVIDNTCVAYISDLHGENRAQKISMLHLGYALGSVAAPPFAAKMVMSSVWNYSYSIMGGFMTFAGLVFLYIMVRYKKAPDTENNTQGNMQKKIPYFALMKNRKMIMLCLISFCQSGAMLFTIWLPTYLIQVNATKYPIEFSSMIITLYFVLSVVSRALLSSALKRVSVINYLKYGSLFSSIAVFTTIIADSRLIWIVGMVVLGIVCGANYTAQTVLICDQFPQYSSTSTSLCGISRAFGNIVLNAAIGMFLQKGLNRTSMMTIVISMMLVSVILWISYDMHGKIKKCDNAVEA